MLLFSVFDEMLMSYESFRQSPQIILLIAAIISLALGIYQSVGTEPEYTYSSSCPQGCKKANVDWVEGLAILIAVALVVMVGAVNDYNKELQFKKLNEKKEDREINVIRGGTRMSINTKVSHLDLGPCTCSIIRPRIPTIYRTSS